MKDEMNCDRVGDKLRRGEDLRPDEQAHAEDCPACSALVDVHPHLGEPEQPSGDLDALFDATEQEIAAERGLRARLRAWPTRRKTLFVLATLAGLAVYVGVFKPRPHDPMYSSWRMFGTLALMLGFSAWAAVRGLRGPDARQNPTVAFGLGFIAVALFDALLPESPSAHAHALTPDMFVSKTVACFLYGFVMGIPVAASVALFDRRDRPLPSRMVFAAAAGGSAGLAFSYLHCGVTDHDHILLGHSLSALVLAGTVICTWLVLLRSRRRTP